MSISYASAAAIKYGVNWITDQGWARLRAELETPPATTRLQDQGGAVLRKSIASMLARSKAPTDTTPRSKAKPI